MEIWKDIKGHEGHHQISNFGRIRSLERIITNSDGVSQLCEGIMFNPTIDRYGYKKIALRINGKRKYYTIHRLVALAFIPNPEKKPQVNHIDEVKLNNHFSNLEWATAKENVNHNKMPIRRGISKFKKVASMNMSGEIIQKFNSIKETEKYGFKPSEVSGCCVGRIKTHKNLYWKHL